MPGLRIIWALAAPFVVGAMMLRVLRKRETIATFFARLTLFQPAPARSGTRLWVHGASVGELAAARPLIDTILETFPDVEIVATAHTLTGVQSARNWDLDRVTVTSAPVDVAAAPNRFMRHWQPAVYIAIESEIWPARILSAKRRKIPVFQVAARLSKSSFDGWRRRAFLAEKTFGALEFVAPQDDTSRSMLSRLGVREAALGHNLNIKARVAAPEPDADALNRLSDLFARDETLLGASTHDGEETALLEAFVNARKNGGPRHLLLAPRHPERSQTVADAARSLGLAVAAHSQGRAADMNTDVYIFDLIGQMPLAYSLANWTFVGGTLVDMGGHTPIEPALYGSVVLHGPSTANQQAAFDILIRNKASCPVNVMGQLAPLFTSLPRGKARQNLVKRARLAITKLANDQADMEELLTKLAESLPGNPPSV